MATKIRLQRHGRKNYAYYHVVIADSRAPRDGKFIERIGNYNPNTNPATVEINFEKALKWVQTGAQPTDTVRNLLSEEGVYMMKHLLGGVKKGAFDEAEAQKRFEAWKADKTTTVESVKTKLTADADANLKKRLEQETAQNKEKAAAIAAKKAKAIEDEVAAAAPEAEEAPVAEEAPAVEEAKEEAPVVTEEVKEEKVEETPAAEETKVEEVKEETPAAEETKVEEVKEEAPAAEEEKAAE